ncbi:sigma-70 family RNA polymerase sigma factor [Solibacillus sp. FSL H8-0523]|uniref:sigma-70 family RNA polymerase sigma factor n=1 Tax=Solibacillus sp. FSL H8-0523 TaxID=2954511 RepID=UPI0031017957
MTEHLKEVMNAYGEYCIRVAYLYVKDWAAAEEIVQDVFLAYYKQHHQYAGRSSLKTYLVKITVHKSHDYLQSWKRKVELFMPSKAGTPSVEAIKIQQEQQTELLAALLQLPIKYREVLLLHYYDDYKIREIADILQVSESTVKTRLVRGRDKLKTLLVDFEWEVLLNDEMEG